MGGHFLEFTTKPVSKSVTDEDKSHANVRRKIIIIINIRPKVSNQFVRSKKKYDNLCICFTVVAVHLKYHSRKLVDFSAWKSSRIYLFVFNYTMSESVYIGKILSMLQIYFWSTDHDTWTGYSYLNAITHLIIYTKNLKNENDPGESIWVVGILLNYNRGGVYTGVFSLPFKASTTHSHNYFRLIIVILNRSA